MAFLQSFGAAEVVTGSCHLLQLQCGMTLLIDCGMFQGGVEERNHEPFGFDPADVDFLLLTHGHLDHVGRTPKLVKEGFRGTIVTHESTMDLAEVVMLDSAHLMKEGYKTRYRKAQRIGKEKEVKKPLYSESDVRAVFHRPMIFTAYDEQIDLGEEFHNDDQLRRIAQVRHWRGDRSRTCKFEKILKRKSMPLVAFREFIVSRKSMGGIQTDLESRVLSSNGEPIPGLYAAGEAAGFGGGGISGLKSLEGTFISSCILNARMATRSIANQPLTP